MVTPYLLWVSPEHEYCADTDADAGDPASTQPATTSPATATLENIRTLLTFAEKQSRRAA
ncbi:hypothetical protein GCM10022247_71390 [Allokutzneria multivorans]|uniref:Uncharacterized protein n=1 Tax=Allokutzneria multivorans TaxID=1142134 RepID=A0ABP7U416_9PSEU